MADDDQSDVTQQENFMNSILGSIYDKLTDGEGSTLAARDSFFAWATPGIPINDDQFDFMGGLTGKDDAETSRRWALAADFAAMVDFIPSPTGVFSADDQQMVISNRRGTLSSEYDRVLRTSQVVNQPLSAEEQAKLDRLQGLLRTTRTEKDLISGEDRQVTDDSPIVKMYNEKLVAFEAAALEFNNGRIDAINNVSGADARFGINGPILKRRVAAAQDDWSAAGHRNEVDEIRSWIAQVTGRSMVSYKARLIERLEDSKLRSDQTGMDFHYTSLAPADPLGAAGWTKFSFSEQDVRSATTKKTNKWSAGGGGFLGAIGFGGKASGDKSTVTTSYDMSQFSLTFELAQFPILRGWLAAEFFESRGWRFAIRSELLSDGQAPPQDGTLPAIPETMIVARNIVLDFAELHKTSTELSKHLSAGGGLTWGPLNFGGKGGRSTDSQTEESTEEKQGILVTGAQIIGYRCSLLPLSPNPDPQIDESWWS